MLVSYKHKFVFLKNKKVASHSITTTLMAHGKSWQEVGEWHGFAKDLPEPISLENCWNIVCFVRCPWDRAISSYEYMIARPQIFAIEGMSFEDWLLNKSPKFEGCYHRALECNRVYRYEQLKADFIRMCDDAGIPRIYGGIALENFSSRRPWTDYYTSSRLIDRVSELYAEDIERFGYTFPEYKMQNGD